MVPDAGPWLQGLLPVLRASRGVLVRGRWLVPLLPRGGAALDEREGDALLDDLPLLVDELPLPGDDAATTARPRFLLQHLAADADGVADEDRLAELPVADRQHGESAHDRDVDAQSAADGEDEQAVGDGPAEGR